MGCATSAYLIAHLTCSLRPKNRRSGQARVREVRRTLCAASVDMITGPSKVQRLPVSFWGPRLLRGGRPPQDQLAVFYFYASKEAPGPDCRDRDGTRRGAGLAAAMQPLRRVNAGDVLEASASCLPGTDCPKLSGASPSRSEPPLFQTCSQWQLNVSCFGITRTE